jgi:hypothetical protein
VYIIFVFESVVDETLDDAGFTSAAASQKNDLEGPLPDGRRGDGHVYNIIAS